MSPIEIEKMDKLLNCIEGGFRAMNVNLCEITKKLNKGSESNLLENTNKNEYYWRPTVESGLEGGSIPDLDYDCVLVQVVPVNSPQLMPPTKPCIATFIHDKKKWWSIEANGFFDELVCPLKVTSWCPIPGYTKKSRVCNCVVR